MKPFYYFFRKPNGMGAIDRSTFGVLMRFLQTGDFPNQREVTWGLLEAAYHHMLRDLEFFCITTLVARVTFENCLVFLYKAQFCDSPVMKCCVLHRAALKVRELLENTHPGRIENYTERIRTTIRYINMFTTMYERLIYAHLR